MDEVVLLVALGASVFYIAFSMKYKTLLLERKFQEQVLDLDKKLALREK